MTNNIKNKEEWMSLANRQFPAMVPASTLWEVAKAAAKEAISEMRGQQPIPDWEITMTGRQVMEKLNISFSMLNHLLDAGWLENSSRSRKKDISLESFQRTAEMMERLRHEGNKQRVRRDEIPSNR